MNKRQVRKPELTLAAADLMFQQQIELSSIRVKNSS